MTRYLRTVLPVVLAAYALAATWSATSARVDQPVPERLTGTYLVLVNANNRYSAERAEAIALLRDLYLGNADTWPEGSPVLPLGRPTDSPASQAFLRLVLDMDQSALDIHWRNLQQSSKKTPPRTIAQPRDLLLSIARDEGAFSLIAEDEVEKLPAKVRVLLTLSVPPIGPALLSIANLRQFIEQNLDTVRRALTDFNRNSGDPRMNKGQARLIHGFEVLGKSADGFLIELAYSWRFLGNQRDRTDYLLVRLVDSDLSIVDRVDDPETVLLTTSPDSVDGRQTVALTTTTAFDGRWKAQFECDSSPEWTQFFEVEITNGNMSAEGLKGWLSGSVDATGAAKVSMSTSSKLRRATSWLLSSAEFSGYFFEHGLNVDAIATVGAGSPLRNCTLAITPLRSREEVNAYLEANNLRTKLSLYNQKNGLAIASDYVRTVRRIVSNNIIKLTGDRVFLEIVFILGEPTSERYSWGLESFLFELQWVDGELEFVGHQEV